MRDEPGTLQGGVGACHWVFFFSRPRLAVAGRVVFVSFSSAIDCALFVQKKEERRKIAQLCNRECEQGMHAPVDISGGAELLKFLCNTV